MMSGKLNLIVLYLRVYVVAEKLTNPMLSIDRVIQRKGVYTLHSHGYVRLQFIPQEGNPLILGHDL